MRFITIKEDEAFLMTEEEFFTKIDLSIKQAKEGNEEDEEKTLQDCLKHFLVYDLSNKNTKAALKDMPSVLKKAGTNLF